MLGIHDGWIIAAYLCCALSAFICIIYGAINWNKGGNNEAAEIQEEVQWEKVERDVESNL